VVSFCIIYFNNHTFLWLEFISSHQGVKQGGLLSAELYKLYIEDLLKTYENSKLGLHIGTLTINAIACADDIALVHM
jgi:hypothetical protein